jgi:hypothetical protein
MQLLNWFDNQKTACYHCVTAWDEDLILRGHAQGMLLDIMPNHNRAIDDLDYVYPMPCGAAKAACLNLARMSAALCIHIVAEQHTCTSRFRAPAAGSNP